MDGHYGQWRREGRRGERETPQPPWKLRWRSLRLFRIDDPADLANAAPLLSLAEEVDDEMDQYDVGLVKTDDLALATDLGLTSLPSVVFFENGIPSLLKGASH